MYTFAGHISSYWWIYAAIIVSLVVGRDLYLFLRYRRSSEELVSKATGSGPLYVLVHGTWGRRTKFIHDREYITDFLTSHYTQGIEIRKLMWSGANLFMARSEAAAALVTLVLTRVAARSTEGMPVTRVCFIGHSHGGNVAHDAAERLAGSGVTASVVTLATPFIVKRGSRISLPHLATGLLSACVIALTARAYMMAEGDVPRLMLDWISSAFTFIESELGIAGTLALTTCLGIGCFALAWMAISNPNSKAIGPETPEKVQSEVQDFRTRARVLTVCTPSDEAFAYLSALKLIDNLLRGVSRRAYFGAWSVGKRLFALGLPYLGVLAIAAIVSSARSGDFLAAVATIVFYGSLLQLAIVALLGLIVLCRLLVRLLSGLLLTAFSLDAVAHCLFAEWHVSAAPRGSSQSLVMDCSDRRGLFHADYGTVSLYMTVVVKWFDQNQRREIPPDPGASRAVPGTMQADASALDATPRGEAMVPGSA